MSWHAVVSCLPLVLGLPERPFSVLVDTLCRSRLHIACAHFVFGTWLYKSLHFVRNGSRQRNSIQCVCCCLSKRFTRMCRGVIFSPNAWSNCASFQVCCCELRGRWHLRICLFWASKKIRGRAWAACGFFSANTTKLLRMFSCFLLRDVKRNDLENVAPLKRDYLKYLC